MSREKTAGDSADGPASQMLQCGECGQFFAARDTNDGELVPAGAARGGRCPVCDGDEFERVVLDLAD
jgi:hypothetical protein